MDSLELIRTFREVATRGSFSKASLAMGLSKANTSKYVAALEERLGVRLLNRSTRSVSMTDAGELLLERSAPLLDIVSMTQIELAERAAQPSGRVHVSAPFGFGEHMLATLLADFTRRHPKVHVSLNLTNRRVDLVEEAVDLVLRVGRIEDSDLIVRRLQQVQLVAVATPDYWARHGRPATPQDLRAHQCLVLSLPTHDNRQSEWRFAQHGKTITVPVSGALDASDGQALAAFAMAGMGVIYLPRLLVQDALTAGQLEPVLEDFMPADVWLYVAYAQRQHNSAAIRALLDFLEQRLRAQPGQLRP